MTNQTDITGAKIFEITDAPESPYQGYFYIFRDIKAEKFRGFDIPIEEYLHSDGTWREGQPYGEAECTGFYASREQAEAMLKV